MLHFTQLAQKILNFDKDRSYPSPEEQLFWRLDDLYTKREELLQENAPYFDRICWSDDDIRYAIPDSFETVSGIEKAIKLAFQDLNTKYKIDIWQTDNCQIKQHNPKEEVWISLLNNVILFTTFSAYQQGPAGSAVGPGQLQGGRT